MEVNVFKLYDGNGIRQFDAINPSYAKWLFDSVNHRDYEHVPGYDPDPFINPNARGPQSPSTIYFDGGDGVNYDLGSSVKNVVLKYDKPSVNGDDTSYIVFKQDNKYQIKLVFFVRDPVGLDNEVIRIGLTEGADYEDGLNTDDEPDDVYKAYRVDDSEIDAETYKRNWVSDWKITKGQESAQQYKLEITLDVNELANYYGVDIPDGEFTEISELWIDIFDIAGNKTRITGLKKFICIPHTFSEFLNMFKPLTLEFVDTYPANLFIQDKMIGSTYVVIENPNNEICQKYGLFIKDNLQPDSLGYLDPYDIIREEEAELKQKIDGIDATGFVKAEGFIWGSDSWSKEQLGAIKAKTLVEGILGKFVTECIDNTRKLFLEPFIPECIKSEMMASFLKFVEDYFNTMFTPMERDCRIGILEKIHRISNFKVIDECEAPLIGHFGDDHGSELDFDYEGVQRLASVAGKYTSFNVTQEELTRKFFRSLPFINKYKGTIYCFNTLFNCMGIHTELIPLWERHVGTKTEFIPESEATDDCHLSSHIRLMCNGYVAKDLIDVADVILRMAESVLPIIRVIENLLILEKSKSSNALKLVTRHGDTKINTADEEYISFVYNYGISSYKSIDENTMKIKIPFFSNAAFTPVTEVEDHYTVPQLNAYGYLHAFNNTIKKYDKNLIITLADSYNKEELASGAKFFNLILKPIRMEFNSNYVNVICTKDNFDKMANLIKYKHSIISFAFSRAVTDYCYSIKYSDYLKK